jgi:hypothetical protein
VDQSHLWWALCRTKVERVADPDDEHAWDVLLRARVLVKRNPIIVDVAEDLRWAFRKISRKTPDEKVQATGPTVILGWVELETTRMSEKMTDETRPVSTPTKSVSRKVSQNWAMSLHAETWRRKRQLWHFLKTNFDWKRLTFT